MNDGRSFERWTREQEETAAQPESARPEQNQKLQDRRVPPRGFGNERPGLSVSLQASREVRWKSRSYGSEGKCKMASGGEAKPENSLLARSQPASSAQQAQGRTH